MRQVSRTLIFRTYVVAVSLAGIGSLAASWFGSEGQNLLGEYPWLFVAFAGLLFLTELKPMIYHADGGEVTASWTFAFALLFIAPIAGALFAASLSTFVADIVRSKAPGRAAFNACQFALCLTVGMQAANQVSPLLSVAEGGAVTISWLLAAGLAGAVSFILNSVIISVVIALHQAVPPREMLRRSLRVNLGMDGVLLALSPVFLLVGIEAPILLPVLLGTVLIIFRSATVALRNRHEATHDQLTDIPNRRLFEDYFELTIAAARQSSERVALIHIDLDGFKGINDQLGHHYGDEVLKEIAARLQGNKRPVDFVARLGGDEFVVTLGALQDYESAERLARQILDELRKPMNVDGVPLAVDASLGVAMFPDDGEHLDTLLNHADIAMYNAKAAGLGVARHASAYALVTPNRRALVRDLERAIGAGELEMYYQPQVDILTQTISGVEALVRWNHPQHGLVVPDLFIPQAEQTELIKPLTYHVIELAARQCKQWLDRGIDITVSVNASARNLHDLKFPDRVEEILQAVGLEPHALELEVTENTVMSDPVRAASVIERLRAIGVSIAIDDFGTGYSSLTSLRALTIDRIKIDKTFIAAMSLSDSDKSIVRSVVDLGKALGVIVVAEGVETEQVLDIARELGCDEFQGYLLAEPLPASLVEPLLESHRRAPVQARSIMVGSP